MISETAQKWTNIDIIDKPLRQVKRLKLASVGLINSLVAPNKFRSLQYSQTNPLYNMGPSNIKDLLCSSNGQSRTLKAQNKGEDKLLLDQQKLPSNQKTIAAKSLGCSGNAHRKQYFKILGNAAQNKDQEAQLAYLYNI